jgi:twinkle protein
MSFPDPDDNTVISQGPCPSCTSSDAYTIYSDGGSYCFSCGHHTRGDGEAKSNHPQKTTRMINYGGEFGSLRTRKLNENTLKKFNVRMEDGVIRFPYYSNGQIVAYKERDKSKNFTWVGKNEDHQLFGQQLFGTGKTIVITEGELDALSVWQARSNWPVVSIPNGAQSARKALQYQLRYLLGFDEIVLMFDGDSAGAQAVEDCIDLFPSDQVFIATLDAYKDASEALQANDAEAIRQAYYNKKSYVPQSIIDGRDLFDLVSEPLHGRDADYPFDALNTVTGGLRKGELVCCTAGSGTGKSTVCGEIAVSLINQGQTVGYIALEESVKRTGLRLMTVAANKPLHLDNQIDAKDFSEAFTATLGSGRVFLRDGFGSVDPDALLNDIRYLVKTNDVQWVILDHLSILISGNESQDERKTLDIVMTKLRSFVEETGIGMILISHLRRNSGDKGHEDGARVSMSQLRGSQSIAQLSDLVIALERDISKGDMGSKLVVLKNRFNGQCGPAGDLTYSKDTGRLTTSLFDPITSTKPTYDDF